MCPSWKMMEFVNGFWMTSHIWNGTLKKVWNHQPVHQACNCSSMWLYTPQERAITHINLDISNDFLPRCVWLIKLMFQHSKWILKGIIIPFLNFLEMFTKTTENFTHNSSRYWIYPATEVWKIRKTFMYFVQLDITPKSWRTVMKYLHFGGVFLSWGLPKTGNTGMRWIRRHLDTALPAAADFGPAGLTPAERPSEKRWWFLQVHQASPRITKFLGDLQDPICGGR